jgi:hypothetical protein
MVAAAKNKCDLMQSPTCGNVLILAYLIIQAYGPAQQPMIRLNPAVCSSPCARRRMPYGHGSAWAAHCRTRIDAVAAFVTMSAKAYK